MYSENYDDYAAFFRGERGPFRGRPERFRAGRGMIEPAILHALQEKPMHGYEVISYLEEKSHGMWRPSPGSVYPTLQLLEERDLIEHTEQDGKKTYRLTTQGKSEANASSEHIHAVFDRFGDAGRIEGRRMNLRHEYQRQFHKQAGEVVKLVRQIFRKGTSEQKIALTHAINDFRNQLEQIWKGEEK